jgi:hypothetical protein
MHIKKGNTINLVTLVMGGNLGPKYLLTHLAIDLIQYNTSHDIHPNLAKSPNSRSPSDFSLPSWDPNLLDAFHG